MILLTRYKIHECEDGCTFGLDSSGICWIQRHVEDAPVWLIKTTIDTYTSTGQFNPRRYRQSGSMLSQMSFAPQIPCQVNAKCREVILGMESAI